MTDALVQNRSDLIQEIEDNIDHFLAARAVWFVDRAVRKVTRNPHPLPLAYLSVFILIFSVLPGFVLVLLLGESEIFRSVGIAWVLGVTVSTLGVVIAYYLGRSVQIYLKDCLLIIQDMDDLNDLRDYLRKLWSPPHPYLWVSLSVVLWGIFASFMFSYVAGRFAGIGVIAGTLVAGFNIGVGFDYLVWIIGLPKHLGQYHYLLNNVDPASSEIVFRISKLSTKVMYAHALYFTLVTICTISIGASSYIAIPIAVAFWATLTIQFTNTQSALINIISSAKWETLNNIQAEIRALQTSGKLMRQETTDAINRLMDLHERVRLTPDSTLNPRTTLNFFNQMMLPLLGALMSYLDAILKSFHLR